MAKREGPSLYGEDLFGAPLQRPQGAPTEGNILAERFGVPPLSVLDGGTEGWQARKRAWATWGVRAQDGRADLGTTVLQCPSDHWMHRGATTGGSTFDPVLCEVVLRWYCPPGGSVLDPFAGESTKGLVAAALGHPYVGVELRAEQVMANSVQARSVQARSVVRPPGWRNPTWVHGDSAALPVHLPPDAAYDLVWTSPPYYDLEQYSDRDTDGSVAPSYEAFMDWYAKVFRQAVDRLRPNRFLAVKVGEIRDKATGAYRGFVPDNVACFRALGLHYWCEHTYVTPYGSVIIRAGRQFAAGRKVPKVHQQVLVFWHGDPRAVSDTVRGWPC